MSLSVKSIVLKKVEECVSDAVKKSVEILSKEYGFDLEEGLRKVLFEDVKKVSVRGEKKEKAEKNKKSLIMCFDVRNVKEGGCQGLKYNGGLFTQCEDSVLENGYCMKCDVEAKEHGAPLCGTVSERVEKGLNFKDSKGRKAIKYLTYLKKEKKSVEEAKEIAEKEGWFLPETEISEKKVEKDKRGRPKKEAKEVSAEKVVDLFAGMVAEASEESGSDSDTDMLSEMMGNMSVAVDEEKEEKKKKSDEKEKKAAEKALEKAKKEQEKALKDQEKALKEQEKAKKAAEKEKKDQEKAKKAAEKEKKDQEKALKEQEKAKAVEKSVVATASVEPEKVKLTVTKFTHEGKEYFKTANGLLYDPKTKEEVGMYCEVTKCIKALPDDSDSELEEEEYEEDD